MPAMKLAVWTKHTVQLYTWKINSNPSSCIGTEVIVCLKLWAKPVCYLAYSLSEHLYFSSQQHNRWIHPIITYHYLSAQDSLPLQCMGSSLLPSTKNFTVGNSRILNSFLKSCWCVTSILPNWILGASFLSCRAASANSSDKFWDDWDKETSGKGQSKENGLHRPQHEAF